MAIFSSSDQATITAALTIIERSYQRQDLYATDATSVKNYCQIKIGHLEHETFCVLLLDTQNRLIEFIEASRGSLDSASVYPREIAKLALLKNAKSLILLHNHPSGSLKESSADRAITRVLSDALGLFDIPILDHIIVSQTGAFSFAENGLL